MRASLTRARLLTAGGYLAWLAALLWLLLGRGYLSFLTPQFGLLLAFASAVLPGFAIAVLWRRDNHSAHRSDGPVRWFILLLPLAFLAAVPCGEAGSHAFDNRGGLGAVLAFAGDDHPASAPDEPEIDPAEPAISVTLADIARDSDDLVGKRVRVIGMVNPRAGLPDDTVVLIRFIMSCCAADARPIGLLVQYDGARSIRRDSWVNVEGVLLRRRLTPNDRQFSLVLRGEKMTRIARPNQPYLR